MGSWGFAAKTIQRLVRTYEGEEYSLSSIYKTLKDAGIRIRDYRDGISAEAKTVIRRVGKNPSKTKLRLVS